MKKEKETDLKEWKIKEIKKLCNFFVEKKYCAEFKDQIEQYEAFLNKVLYINKYKNYVIRDMITKAPGLRTYLQIHSKFKPPDDEDDWFVKEMRDILRVTDEDVDSVRRAEFVPQDILDKLAIFDPEPEGFEVEPIRIEYDFYGFGGPIKIIDTIWENINKETVDVKNFLSQYDSINPEVKLPSSFTKDELDDLDSELPF
jgi:hypothetical protein